MEGRRGVEGLTVREASSNGPHSPQRSCPSRPAGGPLPVRCQHLLFGKAEKVGAESAEK